MNLPWTRDATAKPDPVSDLRRMRDKFLADAMPDRHPPGCVEMDGEYICSVVCLVDKDVAT